MFILFPFCHLCLLGNPSKEGIYTYVCVFLSQLSGLDPSLTLTTRHFYMPQNSYQMTNREQAQTVQPLDGARKHQKTKTKRVFHTHGKRGRILLHCKCNILLCNKYNNKNEERNTQKY